MKQQDIYILAIESSCDETAVALLANGKIVSNVVASQAIHKHYGGVVPELAARAHQQHILPLMEQALQEAKIKKEMLSAIAFTQGPGLLGALLVGGCFAKALAFGLNKPLIAVHHIKAHVLANFIESPAPPFPFLCLVVSGGHTQLVWVENHHTMQIIGQTQDDAVGEAFDKIAKMMDLPYPGGPYIDQYAQGGDASAFHFPDTCMPALDFSFSGIKTAFLYFMRKNKEKNHHFALERRADICASVQASLVQMLLTKTKKAMHQLQAKTLVLAGGVAANSLLRTQCLQLTKQENWQFFVPEPRYCTDNAAMVAIAAYFKYIAADFAPLDTPILPRILL